MVQVRRMVTMEHQQETTYAVTMRLSCTVTEIWRLKDNRVTTLTFLGSRDIIGHVTIRLGICGFLLVVHSNHVTMRLSCTVREIWGLKHNGITSLTFWGHVTSSVT